MSKKEQVFGKKGTEVFELPYEVGVYVPSTQDIDKVISVDRMSRRVSEVKTYLAKTFGGYTSTENLGGFIASDGSLVNEDVIKITSFSTIEDFEKNKEALLKQIGKWGDNWGQEAIGFEYEGDLYYIPKKYSLGGFILGASVGAVVAGYSGFKIGRGRNKARVRVCRKKNGGEIRLASNQLIYRSSDNSTHTVGFVNEKTKNLHISPFASIDVRLEGEEWAKKNGYKIRRTYKTGGEIPSDIDLFEYYEYIPVNVQKVLDKANLENGLNYDELESLKDKIEKLGFTFDYSLDAEPYNLRKVGTRGSEDWYNMGGGITNWDSSLAHKGSVVGFKEKGTGVATHLGDFKIPANSTPESVMDLAKSKYKLAWFVEVADKNGVYLWEVSDDGKSPLVTPYKEGGEIKKLIKDGSLIFGKTESEHSDIYGIKADNPLFIQHLCIGTENREKGEGSKALEHIEDYAKQNNHDLIFGHIATKAKYGKKDICDSEKVKSWMMGKGYFIHPNTNDFYKKLDVDPFKNGGSVSCNNCENCPKCNGGWGINLNW
jgi:hypothetical protein